MTRRAFDSLALTRERSDACSIWGLETGDVEDKLRAVHGECLLKVAQTGER